MEKLVVIGEIGGTRARGRQRMKEILRQSRYIHVGRKTSLCWS